MGVNEDTNRAIDVRIAAIKRGQLSRAERIEEELQEYEKNKMRGGRSIRSTKDYTGLVKTQRKCADIADNKTVELTGTVTHKVEANIDI